MEEKNIYLNSFEIFQEKDDECNNIIREAEKIKKEIQKRYNDFFANYKMEFTNDISFNIIDYDVRIDKFTDVEGNYNPLTPKLYTCIYNPSYNLYKYISSKKIPNEIKEVTRIDLSDAFEPEKKNIIKNYVYDSFIGNIISKEYFENLAKQNFLLNIVRKHLIHNEKIVKKHLSGESDVNILIIHCKLFDPDIKTDSTIYHLSNAILEINNANKFLRNQNFIVVGYFKNFQNENILISQLSESENFKWDKIRDYYPNDFIFINNAEYLDDKINTNDWTNNFLFPPALIDVKNNCLNKIENEGKIFFYSKIKDDGIFYKTEIILPQALKRNDLFNVLVNVLSTHVKLKNADKSEK